VANGPRFPLRISGREALLSPLINAEAAFPEGVVGQAFHVRRTPLVYECAGNFRADEGTVCFFLNPDFRGDDTDIYCTFFGAADWGMIYKYVRHTRLDFATRRPADEKGDLCYNCGSPALASWRPGQWHHVAATWSRRANRRALYIDGTLVSSAPFPHAQPVSSGPLYVGGGCLLYPQYAAHAKIDEFALWDRALSPDQIQQVYAQGRSGRPLVPGVRAPRARSSARPGRLRSAPEAPAQALPNDRSALDETPSRSVLTLDGTWSFLPAPNPLDVLPDAGWGTVNLPGYWTIPGTVGTPQGKPAGRKWAGKPLADYPVAYCRRAFTLPAVWRGRRIFLHLDGVDGVADVYANGRFLATVPPWEPTRLAVKSGLHFGGRNTVTLVVWRRDAAPNTGVYGGIRVEALPAAFLQDMLILPSCSEDGRPEAITFSCRFWSAQAVDAARVIFAIRAAGTNAPWSKTFTSSLRLPAAPQNIVAAYDAAALHAFRFRWPEAHLWTYDDPFLYEVRTRLVVDDSTVDVSAPIRFGFREFRVRNGGFTLNGVPTHLRGHQVDLGWGRQWEALQQYHEAGANCFEFSGPIRARWYTGTPWREALFCKILDFADEHGMIAIPALPDATELRDAIFEPDIARLYARRVDKHLRRYGNHASFCMGFMHFNLAGYRWMIAPSCLDGSYKPSEPNWLRKERYATAAQHIVQKLAPLPIYHHHCGMLGDIYTLNCYIGPSAPLQEREEWPSRWAARRPFPLAACEHGLMLVPYWYRLRQFPLNKVYASEPIFDEITAMYLGPKAYADIPADLFDLYDIDRSSPRPGRNRKIIARHPGYQQVKSLFARRSLRAWRIWGVSGIIFNAIGWDFQDEQGRDLPVKNALRRWFGPTDLAVTGPGTDWPGKDHAWYAGERIRKQAVLINDLTHPIPVRVAWRVADSAGRTAASGEADAVARPGRPAAVPIEFSAPHVTTRTDLRLTVRGVGDAARYFPEDVFEFAVFPRPHPPAFHPPGQGRVLIADSAGETRRLIERLGLRAVAITATIKLRPADRIVVGRKSWNAEFARLARKIGLDAAIANGARLLVFEQTAAAHPFGMDLVETSTRRAFPVQPASPLLNGLEPQDFVDLRGASRMIPAYPPPPPETEKKWPRRFFKWGNRGIVATFVYRKPVFGPFRPVLESGFDLAQAPLLEARVGRGLVLLCNMDVTLRYGRDPVSTRLVHNLFRLFLTPAEVSEAFASPARVRVVPVGGAASRFCSRFRVANSADSTPARPDAPRLLILGADARRSDGREALAAARTGASVLLLPGCPASIRDLFGVRTSPKRLYIARPTDHPLVRGVSASDLYFKQWLTLDTLLPGGGWREVVRPGLCGVRSVGRGRVIACTIPTGDDGRTRAGVKQTRFWSLLLSNLGASGRTPAVPKGRAASLYVPDPWEELPPYIEW